MFSDYPIDAAMLRLDDFKSVINTQLGNNTIHSSLTSA